MSWRSGGANLDLKSSLARPLDSIVRKGDSMLLSHWWKGPGEKYFR